MGGYPQRDQSANDKFNVDGNVGICNISSSDEQDLFRNNQQISQNEQSGFLEIKPEDTSIGDFELDEDPGSNH